MTLQLSRTGHDVVSLLKRVWWGGEVSLVTSVEQSAVFEEVFSTLRHVTSIGGQGVSLLSSVWWHTPFTRLPNKVCRYVQEQNHVGDVYEVRSVRSSDAPFLSSPDKT